MAESGDELDLEPGEFVFLFENTESTSMNGINALWNDVIDAYEQDPNETYDPNFNDLVVYVEVKRTGVDPQTPSITIMPGGSDSTDVDRGGGGGAGTPDIVDPTLEGSATGSGSPEIGPGSSSQDDRDGATGSGDIGIDLDSDYIVIS